MTWRSAASMGTARAFAGADYDGDHVYVAGGQSSTAFLDTAERLDPSAGTWSSIASMPDTRVRHGVVSDGTFIYAIGGLVGGSVSASVVRFDPSAGSWSSVTGMGTARERHAVAYDGSHIYAIGGLDTNGNQLASVERLDPGTQTWSSVASMGTARSDLAAVWDGNHVYAIGGSVGSPASPTASVERLDPGSNSWASGSSMGTARSGLAAAYDGSMVFAIGGNDGSVLATVEQYDAPADAWAAIAAMSTARQRHAAAYDGTDVTAFGGQDAGDTYLSSAEFYAPLQMPVTTVSADTPSPSLDASGTATVAAPVTTVQADTPAPLVGNILRAPATTVQADTPAPTLSASGTATLDVPTTTVTASTPAPTVSANTWILDGTPLPDAITEVATDRTLTLTFRVPTDTLTQTLRPLKSDEGKVAVLDSDDGGFVAVGRANGANTFSLTPPADRSPLRQAGTVHVRRYEETLVSQTVEEWDVEVEFVVAADRADSPTIAQTLTAAGTPFDLTFDVTFGTQNRARWGLTTRYGQIVTGQMTADFVGTGEGGVERYDLTMHLTYDQAHTFEAALSQLAGARIKEVPDGDNVAVDDTGGTATLTVDAPDSQTAVSDGDYVVLNWESTRISEGYQIVDATIAGPT